MNKLERNFLNEVLQKIKLKVPEEVYNDVFEAIHLKINEYEKINIIAEDQTAKSEIVDVYLPIVNRVISEVVREIGDESLIIRDSFQLNVTIGSPKQKSKMRPNIEALRKLQESRRWSEVTFAKKLNIDYSFLYRVLRGDRGIGPTFIGNLIKLCEEEGLNFKDYVIL